MAPVAVAVASETVVMQAVAAEEVAVATSETVWAAAAWEKTTAQVVVAVMAAAAATAVNEAMLTVLERMELVVARLAHFWG